MSYRLFTLAIICSLLTFFTPTLTKQTVAARSVPLKNESTLVEYHTDTYKSSVNEGIVDSMETTSLSETSSQDGATIHLSGTSVTKDLIGRIVPSKCITSKGMLVEEDVQTDSNLIRTLFAPGILVILAGAILFLTKSAWR